MEGEMQNYWTTCTNGGGNAELLDTQYIWKEKCRIIGHPVIYIEYINLLIIFPSEWDPSI